MDKLPFALLLATVAVGACAQSTTPGDSDADKSHLTTGTVGDARTFKGLLSSRNCVVGTGTHIVRKDACANAAGRSYDVADIEQTGTMDTGKALERLDPSITTRAP